VDTFDKRVTTDDTLVPRLNLKHRGVIADAELEGCAVLWNATDCEFGAQSAGYPVDQLYFAFHPEPSYS
jgi:hypothetical protein